MNNSTAHRLDNMGQDLPELLGWTMPGLNRRTIVVTGAGSGIGAATARALKAAGARVLAVDRDADGLRATAESAEAGLETLAVDLIDPKSPQQIVSTALDAFGSLTTLVHIAGVSRWSPMADVTREDLEFHVGVNVYAPFFLTQAALPHLRDSHGQVVFCGSSTSAYRGAAGAVGYDVSKHAVLGMMRALATELAPQGVRVNAISPGTTVSPINDSLFEREGWVENTIPKIPDGRFAQPHEHVGAIAYLISDLAKHVYGHDIVIDGGRLSSS
ncbi:SDR family oxidoreductase [Mycobacterium sp. 21AC1]|uniref:SDR family NAD(P)-dependent oxidoreductase n=1 Tax=[Mycobacterium] appelbergii TaxID=2939269 RepID=UPI002938D3E6|nr:SDR family oxidoreductase [Mycobacterium sp. 21AC1]MDV3124129.1 SDR family oxidoreductase [Mycobacterium sp. 21AC1]